MAHYLVKAEPKWDRLKELKDRLESGEIKGMRPFGQTLHHSLTSARKASEGETVWEEEDYCRPPLAQERAAVLDEYFDEIEVETVEQGEGWEQIEELPSMWE
ncbi:MAG: hypothetical protein ACLFWD_07040 [Anaerolineales bacterium]